MGLAQSIPRRTFRNSTVGLSLLGQSGPRADESYRDVHIQLCHRSEPVLSADLPTHGPLFDAGAEKLQYLLPDCNSCESPVCVCSLPFLSGGSAFVCWLVFSFTIDDDGDSVGMGRRPDASAESDSYGRLRVSRFGSFLLRFFRMLLSFGSGSSISYSVQTSPEAGLGNRAHSYCIRCIDHQHVADLVMCDAPWPQLPGCGKGPGRVRDLGFEVNLLIASA